MSDRKREKPLANDAMPNEGAAGCSQPGAGAVEDVRRLERGGENRHAKTETTGRPAEMQRAATGVEP
jgi:hypothetical protein